MRSPRHYLMTFVGLSLSAATAMAATASTARVLEVGKSYEIVVPVDGTTRLQLRVLERLDDCWIRAEPLPTDRSGYGAFGLWNSCAALAVRAVGGVGDQIVLSRNSIIARNDEALDAFVEVGSSEEYAELVSSAAVVPIARGTRVEVVKAGTATNRVRVLDGPHAGLVGLIYDSRW